MTQIVVSGHRLWYLVINFASWSQIVVSVHNWSLACSCMGRGSQTMVRSPVRPPPPRMLNGALGGDSMDSGWF